MTWLKQVFTDMTVHGVTQYLKTFGFLLSFFFKTFCCRCFCFVFCSNATVFWLMFYGLEQMLNITWKSDHRMLYFFSAKNKKIDPRMDECSSDGQYECFPKAVSMSLSSPVVYATLVGSLCNISKMLTSLFFSFFWHPFIHVNIK